MVCYARPASWLVAIVFVAWLVFAAPVSHFFDTAALAMAVTAATVGAAVAAVLVVAIFMSTRRRRAAAGGCVSCQFRCQHAMAEPARRLRLVTIADRGAPGLAGDRSAPALGLPGASRHGTAARHGSAARHLGFPRHPGEVPARSASVLLPMPTVRSAARAPVPAESCGPAAPRWPDRPVRGLRDRPRERAGSLALTRARRT